MSQPRDSDGRFIKEAKMPSETDRDQWSKINELRDELHNHEKECAEWRGKTNERLDSIEKALSTMSNRLWALFIAVAAAAIPSVISLLNGG